MQFKRGRPIHLPAPPQRLATATLRLACHGAPQISAGQTVRQGDVLSRPTDRSIGCRVSPITGIVRRLEQRPTSDNASTHESKSAPAPDAGDFDVEIEPLAPLEDTTVNTPPPAGRKLSQWLDALRSLGPWMDRDGGVGLLAQLEAAKADRPDTLFCVGLDRFAPYPDHSSLLVSFPEELVLGTILLGDLVGAKCVSLLAGRGMGVLSRLRVNCRDHRLSLTAVDNLYPCADPTLIVRRYAAGQRCLPHGANPVEQGVVLVNPWTAILLGRWFTHQRFDMIRPVMIAWSRQATRLTHSYAWPGQAVSSLDSRLADLSGTRQCVLRGNPMTGQPIVVAESGQADKHPADDDQSNQHPPGYATIPEQDFLITVMDTAGAPQREACTSCGWCVDVCPTGLRPIHLAQLCDSGGAPTDDPQLADHLPWCVHCGLCSHVCPSSIPLAQTLAQACDTMASAGADS